MSETREEAATRRRWVSLAEFVAVAGLLIGALTLYLNWSDRRADQITKAAEAASAGKARSIVTLSGEVIEDGEAIALSDAGNTLSAATLRFPAELKVAPQDAMPGPRLRAAAIAAPLLKMTDNGADEREGSLPVLITVTWWDADAKRSDTALYDVRWRTEGRMLQGRKLVLTGFALNDRRATAAALEAVWKRVRPS